MLTNQIRMPSHFRAVFILLTAVVSVPAAASTTSFLCRFNVEASPKGLKKQETPFELRFVVDNLTSKAYLMGNNGSAEVEIVRNVDGISFLEVTKSGNVMVTTITAKSGSAVHSRNGIMFNELVPSQFYGTCSRNQ